MNRIVAPDTIAPPAANYAHAVLVEAPQRTLYTSGVVPVAANGSVPDDIAEQAALVWVNIAAVLTEAEMTTADIVSVTTYVVASELAALGAVMAARDSAMTGRRTASTLVTVPVLAQPSWKMEIALVASR